MTLEQQKYYFIQYWASTNPIILMEDELKDVLFKVYCEVDKTIPENYGENRLFLLNKKYKQRILKGREENETRKICVVR